MGNLGEVWVGRRARVGLPPPPYTLRMHCTSCWHGSICTGKLDGILRHLHLFHEFCHQPCLPNPILDYYLLANTNYSRLTCWTNGNFRMFKIIIVNKKQSYLDTLIIISFPEFIVTNVLLNTFFLKLAAACPTERRTWSVGFFLGQGFGWPLFTQCGTLWRCCFPTMGGCSRSMANFLQAPRYGW